jgi:hypothetical protein
MEKGLLTCRELRDALSKGLYPEAKDDGPEEEDEEDEEGDDGGLRGAWALCRALSCCSGCARLLCALILGR